MYHSTCLLLTPQKAAKRGQWEAQKQCRFKQQDIDPIPPGFSITFSSVVAFVFFFSCCHRWISRNVAVNVWRQAEMRREQQQ